jgi:hypothetical protein
MKIQFSKRTHFGRWLFYFKIQKKYISIYIFCVMIESKKGGLTLFLNTTKLVGDVSVGVCFALPCNGCAFNRLCGNSECSSNCFPAGTEEAALGIALAQAVRQVLCGDPVAVAKSKVAQVACVAHNGMLGINWKVKGTGSAIRKSIGLVLKTLEPAKMFPAYSRCIKQLGGSVNKDAFTYVADAAARAIKSNLVIGVVGNASKNLDKSALDGMLDILAKKHNTAVPSGSKSKPSDHTACDHAAITEIKVTGWASAVFADFVRNKVKGLTPMICEKGLLINVKPAQWDTLAAKLKKAVKDYAAAKYAKIGENLPAVFGYVTLASGQLCASDVKSAISNKLSTSSIESALTGHL